MRMANALLLALLSLAVLAGTIPQPAFAQADDWSVRKDPFDRRLVGRLKQLLASNPNDQAALKKLVALYRKHRTVTQLTREYEAAAASKATFATLIVLGHLYVEAGQTERAIASYERAAKLQPAAADVHIALGALYRTAGQPEPARKAYEAALASSKGASRGRVLRALADLALADDDIAAAQRYFVLYLAIEPANNQLRLELADALAKHQRHQEAIEVLLEAEKRMAGDPQGRLDVIARIGAAHEALGQDDRAIGEYQRAIKLARRGYHLQRELTERIVEIHRRRQALAALLASFEKDWPPGRRGHFEWDLLARLYEETGHQERAVEAYRKAVRQAPHELDTQRRLIALLEQTGREAEAIAQYEAVIRVAPGEPRFQLELAKRYWQQNSPQQALALLSKIERRFPDDPGVQVALADLYAQWGREDEALRVYVRLTKIEPNDVEHVVNLGEQYFQRGHKDKAVAVWKRLAGRKDAVGLARLGEIYAEHDMLVEAMNMFTRAIALDGQNPQLFRGRARVMERLKHYNDAVNDWQSALTLTGTKPSDRPARREARRRIVAVRYRQGRGRLSHEMRTWEQLFAAKPPDIEAGYFLVEAFLKRAQPTRAREILEDILGKAPDDREAMEELVKVYSAERLYEQAIALLERLAKLSPGREREYYNEIAELKTLLNKDDEAIRYSERALEDNPNDPLAHEQLAKTYEKMQRYDRAVEAYKRTLELDPRAFRVYFRLATLYIRNGQHQQAARLYQSLLRNASDEQVLQQAARKAISLAEITGGLDELERTLAPLAFTFAHKPIYRIILVSLYEHYVPYLVAKVDGDDPKAAADAQAELTRLGTHGLKPLLEALADEENPRQQQIAVSALGYIGNRAAAMPLVKLATAPAHPEQRRRGHIGTLIPMLDWQVRVQSLVAAGRLGDPRIIPELIELLDHREAPMREAAVYALGMTGASAAEGALVRALDNSASSVRMLACFGLAQLRARRRLPLMQALVSDTRAHQDARAACAFALGYIGDPSSMPTLVATLGDGNELVQRVAAWSLGRIGDRRALPDLLSAYFNKGERVREAVAWALPRVAAARPEKSPVLALREFPTANGVYDELAALDALLGALDPPELSVNLILGHEQQLSAGIREALAGKHVNRILNTLSDLDARDDEIGLGPLTTGLDRASPPDRERVRAALAGIARGLVDELNRLARSHPDLEVRNRALSVLSKSGAPGADETLAAGLADDQAEVRVAAMRAAARYARLGGPNAPRLAALIAATLGKSRSWQERQQAAKSLPPFGAAAFSQSLITALLEDPVGFVRQEAARSLGLLGRADAVESLLAATQDDMPDVRVAAVEALTALGDPAARPRLLELAKDDPDPRVRSAAGSIK
jgi:cellulose synthase operon protein C